MAKKKKKKPLHATRRKRGRPRKNPAERLTSTVYVRVTPATHRALRKVAARTGQPLTAYMRDVVDELISKS